MGCNGDIVLRISPERLEIALEQQKEGGVVARKNISPEALASCILGSRYDERARATGLLPEGCVAAVLEEVNTTYFIRYPELYADISYYGTEYLHFPLPRLVFAFQHLAKTGKVAGCRVCVVKDERLTPDTPTYRYPFSNVHGDNRICTGNNALPIYRDPARLHTLAGYLLRLPNNNDLYSRDNNRLHAEYRDLLEQENAIPLLHRRAGAGRQNTERLYEWEVMAWNGKTRDRFRPSWPCPSRRRCDGTRKT